MAKFDPLEFNYELAENKEGVCHFQKVIDKENGPFTDIIELSYWSKPDRWVIFIKTSNLKKFLPPDTNIFQDIPICLFIGELKSDFDFRFIMTKICKDPTLLIQMGC